MAEKDGPQNWRERISALRYVLPVLKLVWKAHHGFTHGLVALTLIRSAVPVAILWVGKLIIDTIVALREGTGDTHRLWKLIALEMAIVIGRDLLTRCSDLIENMFLIRFNRYTSVQVMSHAALLDLYHFEDPAFYDKLERAQQQINNPLTLAIRLLAMAQDFMTLFSLASVLLVYNPWLLLLLTITVSPSLFGETYFASLEYLLSRRRTAARRNLDYLRFVGANKTTAKEVQLFKLSPWLISRYWNISERLYDENKRLSMRKARITSGFQLIGTFGYYTAFAIILLSAVDGKITLGTLTFLAGSFARARDLINLQLLGASKVFSQALFIGDLFDFFDIKPTIISRPNAPAVPHTIKEGLVFENVSFRYPGSESWAVRHVTIQMRPGERVALVGENGAGKTTITKLIARFYDPTEGRILLDGVDIREYDMQSLRGAIGVIFQDFVRYDFRFDENIGVGQIEEVLPYLDSFEVLNAIDEKIGSTNGKNKQSNGPAPLPTSIISAAEKSLASSLLPGFTEGYRQMLGRRFEDGIELSGGEWQKIALARAYMRDAQVLILDEPTAALDARAEYEVFKRFSDLMTDRMAIIISHRFSTVRMADRIIVLQNGSIVEEGPHSDLVALRGVYSELFTLQAEGYR